MQKVGVEVNRTPRVCVSVLRLSVFALAGVVTGYLPIMHLSRIEYKTLDELVTEPSLEFVDLSERYPGQFKKYFGEPTADNFKQMLADMQQSRCREMQRTRSKRTCSNTPE